MVISATARAAAKLLARAKVVRSKPKAKKVKQVPHDDHVTARKNVIKKRATDVVKTSKLLPSPPVKRRLVSDLLRKAGDPEDQIRHIPTASSRGWLGVNIGLLRGGKLRSVKPQKPKSFGFQNPSAQEYEDVKRYETQLARQEAAGPSYNPTGIKYGLGVDSADWGDLRGTDMPYQLKVTDETTLPVMSFFGKTKGFKTKKTLSGKKYRAEIEADAEMGRRLDDHITGGGDGNAWSPPGGSEVYAIYNKQGAVTRYDSMYWGEGSKKSLRDIKELVQSGEVSYTKWKKAPDIHPQVARIEKAGKSTRMIKMSGKEGKARGVLRMTDRYTGTSERNEWAFMQTGDTWMGPDEGMEMFQVGYPTPKVLGRMGVKGPEFKGRDLTKAEKQKRSNAAQRQVALMEKDIARDNEARVKRSTYSETYSQSRIPRLRAYTINLQYQNISSRRDRMRIPKKRDVYGIGFPSAFAIGGGFAIGGEPKRPISKKKKLAKVGKSLKPKKKTIPKGQRDFMAEQLAYEKKLDDLYGGI